MACRRSKQYSHQRRRRTLGRRCSAPLAVEAVAEVEDSPLLVLYTVVVAAAAAGGSSPPAAAEAMVEAMVVRR